MQKDFPKKAISIKNLITSFGQKIVHDNIGFDVMEGEIFGILGGSGSGKSTILREIIMLNDFQGGEIEIFGKNIKKMNQKEMQDLRENWGVLFQFGALFSSLNILDNVSFALKEYTNLPNNIIKKIALSKINMVGLAPHVPYLFPNELSGGMKKRAALARALSLDPRILFLDEPTSGLDPVSAREFNKLIVKLQNMLHFTVIMVTHDLATIKETLDRFIILDNSKIIFDGNYEDAIKIDNLSIRHFFTQAGGVDGK